jgi:amidase
MDDLEFLPAHEILSLIRQEKISVKEVVAALLERIRDVNDEINAFVRYDEEQLLFQAEKMDETADRTRPLFGLPVTVKDNIEVEGIVSTGGIKDRSGHVPSTDATVVKRLRDAGAIIMGKTNCPAFCSGFETENEIYGRTNNPYNLEKAVGSSSGGEAALIAAGGSFLGIGTDTGGSILWPSSYTGICGLAPTFGRVSRMGTIPPYLGFLDTTRIGPMTRSIKDLSLVLPIIMGPDNWDSRCLPMTYDSPDSLVLDDLTIAYYAENGFVEPTPEVKRVVCHAANMLAEIDLDVVETYPRPSLEFLDIEQGLNRFSSNLEKGTEPTVTEWSEPVELYPDKIYDLADDWLRESQNAKGNQAMLGVEFFFWGIKWDTYRSQILRFMNEYDAIVCPVSAKPAFDHGQSHSESFNSFDLLSYTHPYSLVGLPSVTLRGGTSSDALPIGLQIITRHSEEGLAMKIALHLEEKMIGYEKPDI